MKISKYYSDCVSPGGQVFIGYAGSLRIGSAKIPWSASSFWPAGLSSACNGQRESVSSRQGFYRSNVSCGSRDFSLVIPSLKTQGTWRHAPACREMTLLDTTNAHISWQVLGPHGRASVHGPQYSFAGSGYTEVLHLELHKPVLPFGELHWGRFIADNEQDSLIWIAWKKGMEKNWVLSSRSDVTSKASIDAGGLRFHGGSLSLEPVRNLCDRQIGSHFPSWLGKLLGGALVGGNERKSLSRGVWHCPSNEKITGWALHEVVSWQ